MTLLLVKRTLIGLALGYAALCLVMFLLQGRLLYHPSPDPGPPSAYGLNSFERVGFRAADGVALTGWLHRGTPGEGRRPLFLRQRRFARRIALAPRRPRGCGPDRARRELSRIWRFGGPSLRDGAAARRRGRARVPEGARAAGGDDRPRPVARLRSGGRPREPHPRGGLALVSPYTSVPDVAATVYPWLPVHLLARDRFASIDKIGRVRAPLLIIHGDGDGLIPVSHAEALFAAANEPKRLEIFRGGNHDALDLKRIAAAVIELAALAGSAGPETPSPGAPRRPLPAGER